MAFAGALGIAALLVRFSPIVPSDVRVPLATILGLAAICSSMALLGDPHRDACRPRRFMDGPTIVRLVDERDSGRIIDTIDDLVMENMGWTEQHRSNWASSTARIVAGQHPIFVITTRDDHRPIGVVTLGATDDPSTLTLGTWLGAAGRKQGHMRRAIRLITDQLGEEGYSFRVETAADNEPSKQSLIGAGFDEIGSVRHRLPNGEDVDALIFARHAHAPVDTPGIGVWGPPAV